MKTEVSRCAAFMDEMLNDSSLSTVHNCDDIYVAGI